MALGLTSKIFVFIICVNIVVAFAGEGGLILQDENVQTMSDRIDKLRNQTRGFGESMNATSGLTVLDYFNPLNYGWVADGLGLITGFFTDPIYFSRALPNPLGILAGSLFLLLEIMAVVGLVRGVVV